MNPFSQILTAEERQRERDMIDSIAKGEKITLEKVIVLFHYLHWTPKELLERESVNREGILQDLRDRMKEKSLEDRLELIEEIVVHLLFRDRSISRLFSGL